MTTQDESILLILSSPSGTGKTTILERLFNEKKKKSSSIGLVKSISMTTRKPRIGEINGKDYFFITEQKFHELCKAGQMLEYTKIFGNFYGIPKKFIEQNLNNGISILLNINWQGVFHLSQFMKKKIVSIFILPPSMKELKLRLYKRNTDSVSEIGCRLAEAKNEINKRHQYDYIIINDNIDKSVEKIRLIFNEEKRKRLQKR